MVLFLAAVVYHRHLHIKKSLKLSKFYFNSIRFFCKWLFPNSFVYQFRKYSLILVSNESYLCFIYNWNTHKVFIIQRYNFQKSTETHTSAERQNTLIHVSALHIAAIRRITHSNQKSHTTITHSPIRTTKSLALFPLRSNVD